MHPWSSITLLIFGCQFLKNVWLLLMPSFQHNLCWMLCFFAALSMVAMGGLLRSLSHVELHVLFAGNAMLLIFYFHCYNPPYSDNNGAMLSFHTWLVVASHYLLTSATSAFSLGKSHFWFRKSIFLCQSCCSCCNSYNNFRLSP